MPSPGDPYDLAKAGTELWHVCPKAFSPTSFNPLASGRFSARTASPPRAMLYVGTTSDCALWETVLRDIVPEAAPPHGVVLPPVDGSQISLLRLRREAWILDLGRLGVRWIAGADVKLRDRITMLTTVPRYTATHREAARLLTALPRASGFVWPSKQTGQDGAYVFFDPPLCSGDFETVNTIALDSAAGTALIDRALAKAGMHRMDVDALVEDLELELPPDLDDEEL